MRFKVSEDFTLAPLDVREARLKQLILDQMAVRWSVGEMVGEACLMVARSPESPVARAVRSMADELASAKIALFMLFGTLDPAIDSHDQPKTGSALAAGSIRVLRDSRFFDVHEQLILTGGALWIGDCLRRDPLKKDAFERCYFDPRDIAQAAQPYARLWATAVPITTDAWAAAASEPAVQAAAIAAENFALSELPRQRR